MMLQHRGVSLGPRFIGLGPQLGRVQPTPRISTTQCVVSGLDNRAGGGGWCSIIVLGREYIKASNFRSPIRTSSRVLQQVLSTTAPRGGGVCLSSDWQNLIFSKGRFFRKILRAAGHGFIVHPCRPYLRIVYT